MSLRMNSSCMIRGQRDVNFTACKFPAAVTDDMENHKQEKVSRVGLSPMLQQQAICRHYRHKDPYNCLRERGVVSSHNGLAQMEKFHTSPAVGVRRLQTTMFAHHSCAAKTAAVLNTTGFVVAVFVPVGCALFHCHRD